MPIVAVLGGPTASGKSSLALRWASARGLEILSADSRQLYRGFTIGTGAPTPAERALVPHHLVGQVDPREAYSPQRFCAEAESIVKARPQSQFLIVGGTGLYLKEWMRPSVGSAGDRGEMPPSLRAAAEEEIAKQGAAAVHADLSTKDPGGMEGVAPQDSYRIQKRLENWLLTGKSYVRAESETKPNPLFEKVPFVWLDPVRESLHQRIEARIREMFANGWVDEVRELLRTYAPETTPAFNALGYREIAEALRANDLELLKQPESLLQNILARTRQYAKKQTTFFRHQFDKGVVSTPGSETSPIAQAFLPEDLVKRLETSGWEAKSLFPPKSAVFAQNKD